MQTQHEFFRVGRLVPDEQAVLTVAPGTRVREALRLMQQNSFDQLPVVASNHVIGVFSYRSLARGLAHLRRQDDPLEAVVEDLVEDIAFVRTTDDVNLVLDNLEADGVVLVGDETNLLAVATASDITTFLWNATRPFVLLQDVELAVRDLMRSCGTEADIREAIDAATRSLESTRATERLEDLTLSQLMSVLLNERSYGTLFKTAFGRREFVSATLEPVREIRNKVFHFRDDVTADELQDLISAVGWLRRRILIRQGGQS